MASNTLNSRIYNFGSLTLINMLLFAMILIKPRDMQGCEIYIATTSQ